MRREAQRAPAVVFAALFALALALRLANGALGSLKLDDFHSLYHARAPDLEAFFGGLVQDNHPPLQFLLVRASRALFGESEWALRLPALLAGLGTLALVWRIGARLACPRGRLAAGLLVALSSLHIDLSSDVRMYALLGLAGAGVLEGLLACLEESRGAWRIALWTALGLHAHYHFLYTLVALGTATVALGLSHSAYRTRLRACLLALAGGALLAAPWYALGFPSQLAHGLAPGGSNATLLRLFEGFKNLVFLDVSAAGALLHPLLIGASALFLLLIASGARGEWLRGRASGSPALAVLLAAAGLGVPLLTWSAAQFSTRAGYEWRYLAGALPAVCLLVGSEGCAAGAFARARRAATALVIACALVLASFTVRDPGEEDYRDAAAWILAHATPADAVVAADWQPLIFPQGLGWRYYAARSKGPELEVLDPDEELGLANPVRLEGHARVFCILRSLPDGCGLLRMLRQRFAHEEKRVFGRSIHVHVFTRA